MNSVQSSVTSNQLDGKRPLPEGWVWTMLGEATNPTQKRVNPQNYPDLPYIGMENVEPQTMRLLRTVPASEMRSAADSFSPGDVLYGRLRPYLNKVYSPDFSGLCSTEFIIFRKVPHIHSRYLQFFLNSWDFVQFANSLNAGDRPRVKFEQLAGYPFPLPPLPEQERIVARLEELLSDLEAGVAALARVGAGVKRYKASVLKAACEGNLSPTPPSLAGKEAGGLGPLPEGWAWKTLSDVVGREGLFVDGDWVESKDQDPNGDVRLIQLADIGDGYYRNRSDRYLTHKKALILGCTFLQVGDLLVARMPDPLGRACIFPGDSKTSVTVVDVCVIRTGEGSSANHRWLMHAINSPNFRAEVESLQSGSTRKRISRKNLAKIELPVPPLTEQERIVAEVERQLESARAVESAVEVGLKRARRLQQAVLRSAFEGRLV